MICKFCGNEISDGADVCFICGQPVEPVADPVSAAPVAPAAPAEPAYNANVEPVAAYTAPAAAPAAVEYVPTEENTEEGKKKKKVKNPNKVGGFLLFICALLPFIGGFVYLKNRKHNKQERMVQIANATFIGLDIWLFIIVVALGKKYFTGA